MNLVMEVQGYFAKVTAALATVPDHSIWRAVNLLQEVRERGSTVWIVGNGGSAATASHFANDLRKMCMIKAIALPDLTPTVTAYGNDDGWENMFSHPLAVFHAPGDVLVAISCSGASPNVLQAARIMAEGNLIVLTGEMHWNNTLVGYPAAAVIGVDSQDIRVVEDVHLAICHCIAGVLREHV
jgi:D-sedoheptulose 7-phosphate isomerase